MTTLSQRFETFEQGMEALCKASFSIAQAIGHDSLHSEDSDNLGDVPGEHAVAQHLVSNVLWDRTTGNDIGWDRCWIKVSAYGVVYGTVGGLKFGWNVDPEWDGDSKLMNPYTFFVEREFREGSELRVSLEAHGFAEGEPKKIWD